MGIWNVLSRTVTKNSHTKIAVTMTEESNTNDAPMSPPEDKEKTPQDVSNVKDTVMKESEEEITEKDENSEDKKKDTDAADDTTPPKLPPRPIKKARTAYFIFADEKRAEIAARHPGEGVGAVARETGQLWSALSEEEKIPYHEKAAAEKEAFKKALELYKDLPDDAVGDGQHKKSTLIAPTALSLPSARIRKIAKLDPDVKGMSKEALLLITKSAELFTTKLGMETVKVAALQNRRKLLPEDVAHVCSAREQFLFLREDVKDLQQEMHASNLAKKKETSSSNSSAAAAAATNARPLTDYFGTVSKTTSTAATAAAASTN